jgi:hypothetical protein
MLSVHVRLETEERLWSFCATLDTVTLREGNG